MDELQNGAVMRTYAYGLARISEDQLVGSTWTTSFYGYDGHGSVRFLTNMAGTVTDTYNYDAFGNVISSTGSTPNEFLFAGEQFDPALGFYYMRARYYRPATGRFWTRDPIEDRLCCGMSWNPYPYALDNPVNSTDPTGREAIIEYLRNTSPTLAVPILPSSTLPPAAPELGAPILPPLLLASPTTPSSSAPSFCPTLPPAVCGYWAGLCLGAALPGLGLEVYGWAKSVEVPEIGGMPGELALHFIILPVYYHLFCPGYSGSGF